MNFAEFTFTSDVGNRAAYFRHEIPSAHYPIAYTLHSPLRDAPWICVDCESSGRLLGVEVLGFDVNLPRPLVEVLSAESSGAVQLPRTTNELVFDPEAAAQAPWITYRLLWQDNTDHAEARFDADERLISVWFSWNVFEAG